MRKRFYSTLLCSSVIALLFTSINLQAQSQFEGKVTMKFTENNRSHTMDYFMKGNKIRMEMKEQGQAINIIFDRKEDKMIMLMPNQQMYMEYPYKNFMKEHKKDKMDGEKEVFKKTGEMKTINGYNCEKWIFNEDDGSQSVAWMTKELGSFTFFDNPMSGNSDKPEWQQEIEAAGYFPMLVINKDKNGNEQGTMEVTKIEKKNLDNSMFEPPADYKKMEMPMMK